MDIEVIERDGRRYAEIIRANASIENTRFFSPDNSSMQFGLLAHDAGFVEEPHYHVPITRTISDLQQMFVVQRGVIAVDFFTDDGERIQEVILKAGDAILLVEGVHSIRVLEKMQCVSVKQGPFFGAERDKVVVGVKT